MTYLGLFDEYQLRELIIDSIVNRELDQLTAIKNEDKFDIFTYITNVTNYTINLDQSYKYWQDNYREYCIDSTREYNDGLEDQMGESAIESLIDDMFEDNDQFRDYIDLARDHIDVNEDIKEIVF